MRWKAFGTSKVGLAYIENSTISLEKKIPINLRARLCSGHYAFYNSVSLTWLQLPNYCLLQQARLLYVKFSDYCHSADELCQRHILPSVALIKQQLYVVSHSCISILFFEIIIFFNFIFVDMVASKLANY